MKGLHICKIDGLPQSYNSCYIFFRNFRWILCIKSILSCWFLQQFQVLRRWYPVWRCQLGGNVPQSHSPHFLVTSKCSGLAALPDSPVPKSWPQGNDKGRGPKLSNRWMRNPDGVVSWINQFVFRGHVFASWWQLEFTPISIQIQMWSLCSVPYLKYCYYFQNNLSKLKQKCFASYNWVFEMLLGLWGRLSCGGSW